MFWIDDYCQEGSGNWYLQWELLGTQFHDKNPRYLDLYFLLMINYRFTNYYEYERYQDTMWDLWDNGGSEELGRIDFTNPEELMHCIIKYK